MEVSELSEISDNASSSNLENTTCSSVSDSPTQYTSIYKFDFSNKEDIRKLDEQIKKNTYVKEDIITVDDAIIFEEIRNSKCIIVEKEYPSVYRWANEMERMRRNWRISKRKDKGKTFVEFINKVEEKLMEQKKTAEENDLIDLVQGLKIKDQSKNIKSNINNLSKNNSKLYMNKIDFSSKNKKKSK